MDSFWNKKTPTLSLILFGVVDISLFIAVSDDSRFGYWPPVILLVTILLTILNNLRIQRMEAQHVMLREDGSSKSRIDEFVRAFSARGLACFGTAGV
jgi:hypothetical protein